MLVRRLVLVPLLLSVACDRPAKTQAPVTPAPAVISTPAPPPVQRESLVARDPIGAGVIAALDTTVDPCTDFYRYACGGWLKKTVRPADKSRYGRGFGELADRNNAVLRGILEGAAKTGKGPIDSKLGAFWVACNDEAAQDKAGIAPLAPMLAQIAGVKDEASLLRVVGKLHGSYFAGGGPLFNFFVEPDAKRPDVYVAQVAQGGTGLPDRDFYLKPENKALLTAYQEHVARMLGFLGEAPEVATASGGEDRRVRDGAGDHRPAARRAARPGRDLQPARHHGPAGPRRGDAVAGLLQRARLRQDRRRPQHRHADLLQEARRRSCARPTRRRCRRTCAGTC
jgi:hypothetical protein